MADRTRARRTTSVTGGTFPAMIWHTFMSLAMSGEPVAQFADPGSPKYHRWCGRYQFALTWRDARPSDRCTAKPEHHKLHKDHKHHKTKSTTENSTSTTSTPPPAQ